MTIEEAERLMSEDWYIGKSNGRFCLYEGDFQSIAAGKDGNGYDSILKALIAALEAKGISK